MRLRAAFDRISESKLIIKRSNTFTPLSFPIKVDRLRQSVSSEKLDKRIQRIQSEIYKKTKV